MSRGSQRLVESKLKYEGKRYETNAGKFLVVTEYVNSREVTVKFEESGRIVVAQMNNILNGKVRDPAVMVGDVLCTNNYGEVEVIEYKDSSKIKVRFLATGYETTTSSSTLIAGEVRDWQAAGVLGVGIVTKSHISLKNAYPKEHQLWQSMLTRCYSPKYHHISPAYKDCGVSDNFKYLDYFINWCHKQVGFNVVDDKGKSFHLDKDILVKGNKIYSEDTCCFVPNEVNNLLVKSNKIRGDLPIGVYYDKSRSKFVAGISVRGVRKIIGRYPTPEEAFCAYKKAKEAHIKGVANKWKDRLDSRVYKALMNYQTEITD